MVRSLFVIIVTFGLVIPVVAQNRQPTLTTQDAPSLRILSAPLKLDRNKRTVKLSLEIENAGDKAIKSFGWTYRTEGVLREYHVSSTSDMPEVSVDLPPKGKKKVLLLRDSRAPASFFDLSVREIVIVSVTFADGSSWRRNIN